MNQFRQAMQTAVMNRRKAIMAIAGGFITAAVSSVAGFSGSMASGETARASDKSNIQEEKMRQRAVLREKNVSTVKRMFEEMARKDVDAWISHWSDIGSRQLIPYSPDDFPKVVEGKETLGKVYHDLIGGYGRLTYTYIDISPMEDPNKVVVEWGVDIEVLATKGRYQNQLIGIFTFEDGKVVELKEFFNPDNFRKAIAK